MEQFNYPKPIKPQIVRDLDALRRNFNRGMRAPDAIDGLLLATRALLGEHEIAQAMTAEEREQVAAYNRQVDAYNAQVNEHNRREKARRAAQAAAKATAQVRADRCDKCFTVHGKGQTECW